MEVTTDSAPEVFVAETDKRYKDNLEVACLRSIVREMVFSVKYRLDAFPKLNLTTPPQTMFS